MPPSRGDERDEAGAGASALASARGGIHLGRRLFCACLAVRLAQGALMQTFWTPDEFWQAHEVAHRLAFGCGHLTWEWLPEWRLRSPAHPLLFAVAYRALEAVGLDTPTVVAAAPRAIQCVLAAVADCATYHLAAQVAGVGPARWALFFQLVNWFNGYALVRPYSNSLEAVLAVVVFALFAHGARLRTWLPLAALACVIRPTSAVLWICPWCFSVSCDAAPRRRIAETLAMACVAVAIAVVIDTLFYGSLTWTAIGFFRFNFLEGHSALYGTHHPAWYLTEGLPAMVGTMIPFLAFADFRGTRTRQALSASVVVALLLYSYGAHKEFRFVLPLLPLLLVFAGEGLWHVLLKRPSWRLPIVGVTLTANLVGFGFFGLMHQRAPMVCVEALRRERQAQPTGFSVDFLTPCHATPYSAHLHLPGRRCPDLRFLDCSPQRLPGGGVSRDYTDSARFEREGARFVEELYQRPGWRRPRFVVLFEEMAANLSSSSALLEYRQVGRFEWNVESSAAMLLFRRE